MAIPWHRFTELIGSHSRFLLTSHIRPDCDALGSELGMAGVLEALGKEVSIVNAQTTPPNLAFIDPEQRLKALGVDVEPKQLDNFDVLMVLDTSAWAQLGTMSEVIRASKAHKLILDHHVGEDDLGAELFKDPTAEATGRLVLDAARHLGVRVTPEIAQPLFAAIATDTGWFRFGSTNGTTFRAAAELVDAGAVPCDIYAALYEQRLAGAVATARAHPGAHQDRTGRTVGTHGRAQRRFRGHRRAAERHRRRDQHDAGDRRHRSGRDPGRASHRRIQAQLSQPHGEDRLQSNWRASSAAADTRRRPAHSQRPPGPRRRRMVLDAVRKAMR